MTLVATLEEALGRNAVKEYAPMQVGDVPATYADVSDLTAAVDFQPSTPIAVGVQRFVDWFTQYRLRNASGADPAAMESGSTKDGEPAKSGPIAETDRPSLAYCACRRPACQRTPEPLPSSASAMWASPWPAPSRRRGARSSALI